MTQPIYAKASYPGDQRFENGDTRFFKDLSPQDRMLLLLQAYNEAHCELLEAKGPSAIRPTDEPDVVEIEIAAFQTTSTLTASIEKEGDAVWLEPISFKTTFVLPWFPDFTYEWDRLEADTIRLMTCWLEKTFLIHQDRILEQLVNVRGRGGIWHRADGVAGVTGEGVEEGGQPCSFRPHSAAS